MPSPVLSARLRIPRYRAYAQARDNLPVLSTGPDLIFRLQVERIQKEIRDQARILVFPSFESEPLSFFMIQFVIKLHCRIPEDGTHTAHPLTTSVEHDPDWVDLEEASVLWNNGAQTQAPDNDYPQLELQYGENYDVSVSPAPALDDWRVYKGVILELVLTKQAGFRMNRFELLFGVAWTSTLPGLREWAT